MKSGLPEVAEFVRVLIDTATDMKEFRELLIELMGLPGRILAPECVSKFPLLVLNTCLSLGGTQQIARPAAAAVEFVIVAADIIDDVADDEWVHGRDQESRALNATLALSWLAQRSIYSLIGEIGAERILRLTELLQEGMLRACSGEDLDLRLERDTDVSEEVAHEVTLRKSGSLVEMACKLGAAATSDDPAIIATAGEFGAHLGLVDQLLNDLAGIDLTENPQSSDIRRRKKTLPVAYALNCAREEALSPLIAWYQDPSRTGSEEEARMAAMIHDLGAVHYTWAVAEFHRREALAALARLRKLTGRAEVTSLRRFIPSVHAHHGPPSQP